MGQRGRIWHLDPAPRRVRLPHPATPANAATVDAGEKAEPEKKDEAANDEKAAKEDEKKDEEETGK